MNCYAAIFNVHDKEVLMAWENTYYVISREKSIMLNIMLCVCVCVCVCITCSQPCKITAHISDKSKI